MTTRRISVNVGGLWRTSVELKEGATWWDLRNEIENVTGIWQFWQKLEPTDENNNKCFLEEGDDVYCNWKLPGGAHPLHYTAFHGNKEAIQSWLASGADANVVDECERTPLMYTCMCLEEECVIELLRTGANVQMIDKMGNTALYFIVNRWHSSTTDLEQMEKIAKILIKAGCDPTKRNIHNETFVDVIKKSNHELATKLEEWMKERATKS